MNSLSRRRLLGGGLALGAMLGAPAARRAWSAAHEGRVDLVIGTRVIEVKDRPATVFGLTQRNGHHGLVMDAGRDFQVRLTNACGEPALIHWHGLKPPNAQDGVPGVTQPLLDPGGSYDYDFPVGLPGTNWMHSHSGLQEQRLMAAPLIVRDPAEAGLDEQEVVIMLHDFTFRDPEEILAELAKGMSHASHSAGATPGMEGAGGHSGHKMNHDMGTMDPAMDMGAMGMGAMGMGAMGSMADLNDVAYDAYLANDRTLDDPAIVNVERGGRVRLRIINAAASSNFVIDLGGILGTLIAVDGRPILPIVARRFPLAMAQRADIRLDLPEEASAWPILARREGDRAQTGIILAANRAVIGKVPTMGETAITALDPAAGFQPVAAEPLADRPADRRLSIALLGNMMTYAWGLADLTNDASNIAVRAGERVELELVNRSSMSHPMHLHGHHFQITAVNGGRVPGAVRDTVLVPVGGRIAIAFDADNPGRWMFHCHNLYHMVRGMMTEVAYL